MHNSLAIQGSAMMRRPAKKPTKVLPPPRVRREPPTIEEAIAAAQDLTEDREQQIEIAAGFMGVPQEEVRAQMPLRINPARSIIAGNRAVVVERRIARPSLRRVALR
jgi:hypothetical protein